MSYFENQIEERRNADDQLLEDSFDKVLGAVLGQHIAEKISDERIITKNAIDEILKYYHYKPVEPVDSVKDIEEQLDYCLRPHGIMRRKVELTDRWYQDAYGPILAFGKEDGVPVALLPGAIGGYHYRNPKTGEAEKMNEQNAALFSKDAICFYRPLPQRELGILDLLLYMKRCLTFHDMVMLVAVTMAVTVVGFLLPRLTKMLAGPILVG